MLRSDQALSSLSHRGNRVQLGSLLVATSSHHGGSRTKDGERVHFTLESQCQRHIDHLQPIDPSTPSTLSIPTISHALGSIFDAPTSLCVSQDESQSPHEHGQWIPGGSGKSARWGHTVVSLSPGSHEHLISDPWFPAGLVSLRQDATSPFMPLNGLLTARTRLMLMTRLLGCRVRH